MNKWCSYTPKSYNRVKALGSVRFLGFKHEWNVGGYVARLKSNGISSVRGVVETDNWKTGLKQICRHSVRLKWMFLLTHSIKLKEKLLPMSQWEITDWFDEHDKNMNVILQPLQVPDLA